MDQPCNCNFNCCLMKQKTNKNPTNPYTNIVQSKLIDELSTQSTTVSLVQLQVLTFHTYQASQQLGEINVHPMVIQVAWYQKFQCNLKHHYNSHGKQSKLNYYKSMKSNTCNLHQQSNNQHQLPQPLQSIIIRMTH